MSAEQGFDINEYDELEKRFEPNCELKWLADYFVNALVLCKHTLKIETDDLCADIVDMLWKTMDYKNIWEEVTGGGAALHTRINYLQEEITGFYERRMISKDQVRKILDYSRQTLFNHMHLYLTCLSAKQPKREKVIKIFNNAPKEAPKGGLDTDQCV